MKSPRNQKDGAIALLLIGLFLLIIALTSFESKDFSTEELKEQNKKINAMDLVNKHLREVYDRQEIDRKNVENINALTAPPMSKAPKNENLFHFDDLPLTFSEDSNNELLGKDLRVYATTVIKEQTLSQKIQQEVIADIQKASEEEVYKKALADSIVKKAKNQGFDIQIDENYKIKNIRKMIIKEKPSVFDSNELPNQ